eukprot:3813679-Prymnesium_polylepis.1
MRVARLHHVTDCGRKVFVTPAGKLVCEHGEFASSIGSWVSAEQAAQRVGELPFSRNSVCSARCARSNCVRSYDFGLESCGSCGHAPRRSV